MLRSALLLGVICTLAASAKLPGKCPKVLGKFPFDEAKFDGEWFAVAGMAIMDENVEETKCGKFSFHLGKGDHSQAAITYKAYNQSNQAFTYEAVIQSFKFEKASMAFTVWKKEGDFPYTIVYKQNIVATDYENYAVLIACRPSFDPKTKSFGRHLFAYILSRQPTLSKEKLDILTNVISGFDIDTKLIKTVDRTICDSFN